MKLLFCKKCQDTFKLTEEYERTCKCGAIGGKYTDELYAIYWGIDAVPVIFVNDTFAEAIRAQPKRAVNGVRFTAAVVPKECATFRRIKKEDDITVGGK